jgi:hypothetical protein
VTSAPGSGSPSPPCLPRAPDPLRSSRVAATGRDASRPVPLKRWAQVSCRRPGRNSSRRKQRQSQNMSADPRVPDGQQLALSPAFPARRIAASELPTRPPMRRHRARSVRVLTDPPLTIPSKRKSAAPSARCPNVAGPATSPLLPLCLVAGPEQQSSQGQAGIGPRDATASRQTRSHRPPPAPIRPPGEPPRPRTGPPPEPRASAHCGGTGSPEHSTRRSQGWTTTVAWYARKTLPRHAGVSAAVMLAWPVLAARKPLTEVLSEYEPWSGHIRRGASTWRSEDCGPCQGNP